MNIEFEKSHNEYEVDSNKMTIAKFFTENLIGTKEFSQKVDYWSSILSAYKNKSIDDNILHEENKEENILDRNLKSNYINKKRFKGLIYKSDSVQQKSKVCFEKLFKKLSKGKLEGNIEQECSDLTNQEASLKTIEECTKWLSNFKILKDWIVNSVDGVLAVQTHRFQTIEEFLKLYTDSWLNK